MESCVFVKLDLIKSSACQDLSLRMTISVVPQSCRVKSWFLNLPDFGSRLCDKVEFLYP